METLSSHFVLLDKKEKVMKVLLVHTDKGIEIFLSESQEALLWKLYYCVLFSWDENIDEPPTGEREEDIKRYFEDNASSENCENLGDVPVSDEKSAKIIALKALQDVIERFRED